MRIDVPRWLVVVLAAVFSAYHLVLAAASLSTFPDPVPAVVAMVLYAAATVVALLPSRGPVMPLWAAGFALAVAVVLPLQIGSELEPTGDNGYATWYVAAVGTLLTIVATRRRQGFAWVGIGFLSVHTLVWGGLGAVPDIGVPGSISWVALSHALTATLARADRETREFVRAAQEAAEWQAAQEAHVNERQVRLEQTGRTARPMLEAIVATGGDLDDGRRQECLHLEGAIRDEIRGRSLLDDEVRREVMAARRRGTVVSLLDEGGLDDLDPVELRRVHGELAAAVRGTHADRLVVRTVPDDPDAAVTVVGLGTPDPGATVLGAGGSGPADEDDDGDEVRLWLRIPRSTAQERGAAIGATDDA